MFVFPDNVFRLEGLVECSSHGIVNKVIYEQADTIIDVLAFSKHQNLNNRSTPFEVFIYILTGKIEMLIEQNRRVLNATESIFIPANSLHSVHPQQASKILSIREQNKKSS